MVWREPRREPRREPGGMLRDWLADSMTALTPPGQHERVFQAICSDLTDCDGPSNLELRDLHKEAVSMHRKPAQV